jgi:propanol-preferring alcohol dehydrogenase
MLVKVAVGFLCHTDGIVTEGILGTKLPCIASHDEALFLARKCGADTMIGARGSKEKGVEEVKKVTRGQ